MKLIGPLMSIAFFLSALSCASQTNEKDNTYAEAREKMVEEQLVRRGIEDERVLAAMRAVERHRFVPEKYREYAYIDDPLPIGEDQTISQPYIVALMTQLLELEGDERVLEIGTGSGYQAAILGELAPQVFTVEIIDTLGKSAERLLKELGYENVTVRIGDGYQGWPEEAPFDAIIVTAAPPKIPQPLLDQLADGGRMVVPVGDQTQDLTLIVRSDTTYTETIIAPVRFVPMTGKARGD